VHLNLCLLIGRALLHTRAKSFASKYSVLPQAHSTRNIIPRSAASPNVSTVFVMRTKEEQKPCAVKLTCGNLPTEICMSKTKTGIKPDQFESSCDELIALCGGDARSAVKALLIANAFLEVELALTKVAVSYGYSKGWHAERDDPMT
jgi:hypothetical protein